MSDELPQGWVSARLKEVVSAHKGKKPEVLREKGAQGWHPYLLIDQLEGKPARHFTNDSKVILAAKDDVLLVWDGSIGKCARGLEGAVGSTIVALKPIGIRSSFLEAFIKQSRSTLQQTSRGTGLQHINQEIFWDLEVPLAPLPEQRRIVAKLEMLLGKVDACEKRLAKIPVILKRFRQSILSAACSGRLTEDWREKNPDVKPYPVRPELESGAVNVDETFPRNWRVINLGMLTTLVTSGSRGWAKYYAESGSIFIRAQNINSDILDLTDIAFVKLPNHAEGLRTRVQQYDILITITGANVTKSALVEIPLDTAFVSQHVALVRLADIRLSRFLFYCVISLGHGRKQLLDAAYGQGKPGLNLDNIRNVVVGLPPLPEQQEIVRRVEALFALADQIEARYMKAKAYVDKLTQSILVKAFRGELVPQDPNDEPASVLLARIKKERSKTQQTDSSHRTRKRKRDIITITADLPEAAD